MWGYGHVWRRTDVKLDRASARKALHDAEAKLALAKNDLNCSVEDKDTAKGKAFKVRVPVSPTHFVKERQADYSRLRGDRN